MVCECSELGLPLLQITDGVLHERGLAGVHSVDDALLGVRERVGPQLVEEGVESNGELRGVEIGAEDQVGEQCELSAEPLGVRGAELDRDPRGGPWRWWHEEPGDGELEGAGKGDDLVGVEVADATTIDGALGGGVVGDGPAGAEVRLECVDGLLLGPAAQLPGLGEVERDDLVRGQSEEKWDLWFITPCL